MNLARELRRIIRRIIRQELAGLHYAFPAVVEEYLGAHPDAWGTSSTPGVLKARALIRPKFRLFRHGGRPEDMPLIFNVPVSWYRLGPFLFRFPMRRGDTVMCVVSERALDHILETRDRAHPRIKEPLRLEDAVVLPFGLRTDTDPLTPPEYTNDLYIAMVDENNTPISRFIMRGPDAPIPGEIKFVCPQFTVISPSIDLGDYGGQMVARVTDQCVGCGTCVISTGSPIVRAAVTSSYAPGPSGGGGGSASGEGGEQSGGGGAQDGGSGGGTGGEGGEETPPAPEGDVGGES